MFLKVQAIVKSYTSASKNIQVLRGVGFEIEKNSITAVIGPSGVGKSTLLHILGGLDAPDKGEVFFEGNNLYRLSEQELALWRNKAVGFVFQFYHLMPEFTVLENVLMPAWISRDALSKDVVLKEALDLLKETGLGERIDHFPSQLSGGEKQRVALVRALINKPQLLLCDEPTGNLDSATGKEIIALLERMRKVHELTLIMVTHNPDLAKIAGTVYNLEDGLLHKR